VDCPTVERNHLLSVVRMDMTALTQSLNAATVYFRFGSLLDSLGEQCYLPLIALGVKDGKYG
jgi:hypothetical protein